MRGLPQPLPNSDTQTFWDACEREVFLVPSCVECRRRRWPPGPMCPYCQSTTTEWVEVKGPGRVYSWVVVTHSVHAATADQVPYVVALVDIGDVRVIGNVVGCQPDEVEAGMTVELFFDTTDAGTKLPNFRKP